ncbi:MAG TPA: hypothetical protein VGF68_05765 [Solirubrobacteraceae bacterium]
MRSELCPPPLLPAPPLVALVPPDDAALLGALPATAAAPVAVAGAPGRARARVRGAGALAGPVADGWGAERGVA